MKRLSLGLLLFALGMALLVGGCHRPMFAPNSVIARCPMRIPTITGQVRNGMSEGDVRYALGAPQVRHQMHDSYCRTYRWKTSLWPPGFYYVPSPCDQMTRLIYWDGNPEGRSVEILLNWDRVINVNERAYPRWLVDAALAQSVVGKDSSAVRQTFGEPTEPNGWGQYRGAGAGGPNWSYREGQTFMEIYFTPNGRVVGVVTGIVQAV